MKTYLKPFLSLAFITMAVSGAIAQTPAEVLAHGSEVTFLGIDFSGSKGVVLEASAEEMRDDIFPAINTLMLVEEQKYNIKKALLKSEVTNDPRETDRMNATLDVANFSVYSLKEITPLTPDVIAKMVKQYNLKGKKGIGLVFIAESLDKIHTLGTYYLVYFSMPEGKVILSKKFTGTARGFGLRNYWAHTIYNILQSDVQQKLEQTFLQKEGR
jgi:hypothetical protein